MKIRSVALKYGPVVTLLAAGSAFAQSTPTYDVTAAVAAIAAVAVGITAISSASLLVRIGKKAWKMFFGAA